jgi:ankyrin repeat protein
MLLREVVTSGSYDEIRNSLECNPGNDNEEMSRALLAAVRRGEGTIVTLILEHGADPNRVLEDDWMPLHSAVEHEQIDLIRLLVDHGADVNARDQGGGTPLHLAVDVEGDGASQLDAIPTAELSELLIALGADPTIKDHRGRTALDVAHAYDHKAAIALLTASQGNQA